MGMNLKTVFGIRKKSWRRSLPIFSTGDASDRIFYNGRIYTLDAGVPWAEAVAIKDGVITYVGETTGALALRGATTEIIDLKGKMLLPGFIDSHAHLILAAGLLDNLFVLDPEDSVDSWLKIVKREAGRSKSKDVIMGSGFTPEAFGSDGPDKESLDAISPDKPVAILDEGFHSAWVNSRMLELLGVDKDTVDPSLFSYYKRDSEGEPTGYLIESEVVLPLLEKTGLITADLIAENLPKMLEIMNHGGVTSYYDAGMMSFEKIAYDALKNLEERGGLNIRVAGSHMLCWLPENIADEITELKRLKSEYSNKMVHANVLKIMNDGTMENHEAALFDSYSDKEYHGNVIFPPEKLKEAVCAAAEAGFDVHVHSIGDRAIANTLDAYEAARMIPDCKNNRFTIAHTELIRDKDIKRFAKLDVTANTTPVWFVKDPVAEKVLGDRAVNVFRYRQLRESGARVTFGSDFPASELSATQPLLNIQMGMTRRYESDGEITNPDELQSLEEMIRGYTIDAACQLGFENEVGSIEVGKCADMIVLDRNLFAVDPYTISDVKVEQTILNGKTVYKRSLKSRLYDLAVLPE